MGSSLEFASSIPASILFGRPDLSSADFTETEVVTCADTESICLAEYCDDNNTNC